LKKSLSPTVVNTATQSLRNDLLEFGVYGMKVLGAGNGGFMLVYASEEKIEVLKKKLGNKAVTFGISKHGAISSIV